MLRTPLLLLVLVIHGASAQDWEYYIRQGEQEYSKQNFKASAAFYDTAIEISRGRDYSLLYNAACSHSLAGDLGKSIGYLTEAFDEGANFADVHYDKDFNPLRELKAYKALEQRFRPANTIYFFDIVSALSKNDAVQIDTMNVDINGSYLDKYSIAEIQRRSQIPLTDDTILNFSGKRLTFFLCSFSINYNANDLQRLAIQDVRLTQCTGNFGLSNCAVNNISIIENRSGTTRLSNLIFDRVNLQGTVEIYSAGHRLEVIDCSFGIDPANGVHERNALRWSTRYEEVILQNSTFYRSQKSSRFPLELDISAERTSLLNCRFEHATLLRGRSTETLDVVSNGFPEYLDLFAYTFPEHSYYMPFRQFQNTRFVSYDFSRDSVTAFGTEENPFEEELFFNKAVYFYKNLYDNARQRGDLASSNAIYIRLKNLEISHFNDKRDRTTEEIVRLRLNQLMGMYTDHATSPGKAIIVSFYIILLFAVFFFFFPSEWDKTSKARLIADFKMFIEKNEHGYVKPFFRMLKGFSLSFLNAITLSVNAFITLGFGNIPTRGLPRYVCVFEGLLGWFLLSLFTVALLNQVLI